MIRRALILLLPLLAACTGPAVNEPGAPTVRHFASTDRYADGAAWHGFVFKPQEPRPLDTRIELARAAVMQERACRWAGASRAEIAAKTQAEGPRYADTLLVAPLYCDG